MFKFRSIRARLTFWYTSLVAAALIVSGVSAYFLTRDRLYDNLDLFLTNETSWIKEFAEPRAKEIPVKQRSSETPTQAQPPDEFWPSPDDPWNEVFQHTLQNPREMVVQIFDRNGDLLYRSTFLEAKPLPVADILPDTLRFSTVRDEGGRELRIGVRQTPFVKIMVARDLDGIHQTLSDLLTIRFFLSPITTVIALLVGLALAHRLLKPVNDLARTAEKITAQNLNVQLPVAHTEDEVGRLTKTFNEMISRLHESFSHIQQFSVEASHELRTPLTIMRGEIEVSLRNARLPKPARDLLNSMHDELVRLSSIVENLMTLVNTESGSMVVHSTDVALDTIINEVADDARTLAGKKKIKVSLDPLEPVNILGDPQRLRQLFLILVDNAVKFTPPHGTIALSLERVNGHAIVSVKDTGIGVPRKERGKIFDRFYRAEAHRSLGVAGSGLGLSIAKWIAEAHDGTIDVRSREKSGSTFIVTLPAKEI
jgi:signal transduction histidine kinase